MGPRPGWFDMDASLNVVWAKELEHGGSGFRKVEDRLEMLLEEDVTAVWTLGLQKTVQDYRLGKLDAAQVEEPVKMVAANDTTSVKDRAHNTLEQKTF
jgi:hypothetical protein